MRILIGKALKHLYMLWESLMLCKHGHILFSLTFKKTQFKTCYYIYIIEIPTNKGANSYKLKISNKGANSYKLNISKLGNYLIVSSILNSLTYVTSNDEPGWEIYNV